MRQRTRWPIAAVGDVIAYTLTVVVANSQTTDAVVLTDTLGTGLTFGAVTVPGIFVADTSGSPLRFTLPANTTPGTYAVTYTAQVNALASVSVANAVLGSGGDNPTCASASERLRAGLLRARERAPTAGPPSNARPTERSEAYRTQ